jgi:uncharacterized protein YggE
MFYELLDEAVKNGVNELGSIIGTKGNSGRTNWRMF